MKWLGIATSLCSTAAQGQQQENVWTVLQPIAGHWNNVASGFGSVSDAHHAWDFALQGQFLGLTTQSAVCREEGSGEAHKGVGS